MEDDAERNASTQRVPQSGIPATGDVAVGNRGHEHPQRLDEAVGAHALPHFRGASRCEGSGDVLAAVWCNSRNVRRLAAKWGTSRITMAPCASSDDAKLSTFSVVEKSRVTSTVIRSVRLLTIPCGTVRGVLSGSPCSGPCSGLRPDLGSGAPQGLEGSIPFSRIELRRWRISVIGLCYMGCHIGSHSGGHAAPSSVVWLRHFFHARETAPLPGNTSVNSSSRVSPTKLNSQKQKMSGLAPETPRLSVMLQLM